MVDVQQLSADIRGAINKAASSAPRSMQKSIGPSEVGTQCIRRIGYRLLGTEPVNQPDQWLATIGTAVHSWLAETYAEANRGVVPARYLVEQRVEVTEDLAGNVDLYDSERKLVLDWKIVGDTSLKRYKAHGPSEQYRTQVHLYGLGFRNKGYEVDNVGIVFLPRGGSLRGLHIHVEPFDESVALAGIERLSAAKQFVELLGPKAIEALPGTEAFCHFCPFYLPASTDLQVGCPGADKPKNS